MKKFVVLSVLMVLILASCGGKLTRPTSVGKSYAVIVPEDVPIYRNPSLNAEVFYLEEAESFVTEEAVCEGGGGWWSECILIIQQMPEKGFLRVKFESGKQGYINFKYFFPKASYSMTTEERTALRGTTPKEYAATVRQMQKATETEYWEKIKIRKELILSKPWSDNLKRMVIKRRIKIGMTKEQVMLSHNPPDMESFTPLKKVSESVTSDGMKEKWLCNDISYYFQNDLLIGWESLGRSMNGDKLVEPCQ